MGIVLANNLAQFFQLFRLCVVRPHAPDYVALTIDDADDVGFPGAEQDVLGLEAQIATQTPLVNDAFVEGNQILSRMRALTVEPGPVEARSVEFSEQAVRLAGLITRLRQLSVAPLVERAARKLLD